MPPANEQPEAEVSGLKLLVGALERDDRQLPETKALRRQSRRAPGLSSDLGELSTVVGLRGGSRGRARFWRTGSRMLRFEIGPTISRLSLAIIDIGVDHLLRRSCHLGFPSSI
jgi:hypothetical protein